MHSGTAPSVSSPLLLSSRSFSLASQCYFQQQQQRWQQTEAGRQPRVKAVDKQSKEWELFQQRVQKMKAYLATHRRLPPGNHHEPDTNWMARDWLNRMRRRSEHGTLPPEMAGALDEALGDVWRVRQAHAFSNMLHRLKRFVHDTGRLPKRGDVEADGVRVGCWLISQRGNYFAGKLSAERIAALENVPGWSWRGRTEHEQRVSMLEAFVSANDRLPKQHESWDGYDIGTWVNRQRMGYCRGKLIEGQVAAMESVPGWVWKTKVIRSRSIPFEIGLANLNNFVQARDRLPTIKEVGDEPDKMHLGSWMSNCRKRKKKGMLTPAQITALEQVPGWCWRSRIPFRL